MYKRISRRRAIFYILIAVLVIALFACALYLIDTRGRKDDKLGDSGDWGDDDDDLIQLYIDERDFESEDSIKAYVLAGTDNGGEDYGEGYNGELADFITLILIDDTTEKYAFYQIDRNSMVELNVPDLNGNYNETFVEQICIAHWYGEDREERASNLMTAVTDLLGGLDIDGYYILNMVDIGKVNNAIGGVVVEIETDMTEVDPEFVEGNQVLLTDDQAEKYLRARMGLKDDSNSARMSRQTQYMQNAYNMIIGQLRENPDYINDLYEGLSDVIYSDSSPKDLSVVAAKMLDFDNVGIIRFSGRTEINDTLGDGIEHEEFYVNGESIITGLRKTMNLTEVFYSDDEDDTSDDIDETDE